MPLMGPMWGYSGDPDRMPKPTDNTPKDYKIIPGHPNPPPIPDPKEARGMDYGGFACAHRGLIGLHTHLGTGYVVRPPLLRRARRIPSLEHPRRAGPMDVDPNQGLGVRTREQARMESRYGANIRATRQRLSFIGSYVDGAEMRVGRHTRFGRQRDQAHDRWYWNAGYGRWEVRYHDEL